MRRLATLVGIAMLALLTVANPASAHNVLVSSDPSDGARLDSGPQSITLTFDQFVQDAGTNQVAVTGPDGGQWAEDTVRVDGTEVVAPVRPLGPAGEYVIGFRILSADGHSVTDEIRFTLTEPGPGTPATTASEAAQGGDGADRDAPRQAAAEESSGVPVWVWIAGVVVLLGIGLVVALRMGGSQDRRP